VKITAAWRRNLSTAPDLKNCKHAYNTPTTHLQHANKVKPHQPCRFSIAPMMEWTDRAEKQSVVGT
jgi:hypothetical protein